MRKLAPLCGTFADPRMEEPNQIRRIESRWLVILAIMAVFILLIVLPGRVREFPIWIGCVLVSALIAPMVAVSLATDKRWLLRIESFATGLFILVAGFALLDNLQYLLSQMVRGHVKLTGLTLLTSSIAVWATNVLIYSLVYWRMDRGGPEARANQADTLPDWLFPQEDVPELVPIRWHPSFVDYLFLSFCTATAFSPTDALPLTARAKALMMLEGIVSLVTIIIILARAINTLGT
jgi:uncharacterized membrane protein